MHMYVYTIHTDLWLATSKVYSTYFLTSHKTPTTLRRSSHVRLALSPTGKTRAQPLSFFARAGRRLIGSRGRDGEGLAFGQPAALAGKFKETYHCVLRAWFLFFTACGLL